MSIVSGLVMRTIDALCRHTESLAWDEVIWTPAQAPGSWLVARGGRSMQASLKQSVCVRALACSLGVRVGASESFELREEGRRVAQEGNPIERFV